MRTVKISIPTTLGHQSFPAGHVLAVNESTAEDLIARGHAQEVVPHGAATMLSGHNSVVVTHDLKVVPLSVLVSGSHSEVASCWVDAFTPHAFTIHAPSNVTADRVVYWRAYTP